MLQNYLGFHFFYNSFAVLSKSNRKSKIRRNFMGSGAEPRNFLKIFKYNLGNLLK